MKLLATILIVVSIFILETPASVPTETARGTSSMATRAADEPPRRQARGWIREHIDDDQVEARNPKRIRNNEYLTNSTIRNPHTGIKESITSQARRSSQVYGVGEDTRQTLCFMRPSKCIVWTGYFVVI